MKNRISFGKPVTGELSYHGVDTGKYRLYENGGIFTHPNKNIGTFEVHGKIYEVYENDNFEKGLPGFLMSDQIRLPTGVLYNKFQNGKINWHPATEDIPKIAISESKSYTQNKILEPSLTTSRYFISSVESGHTEFESSNEGDIFSYRHYTDDNKDINEDFRDRLLCGDNIFFITKDIYGIKETVQYSFM